ncbi:Protein transport protein SEC23 [Auxenochlorella protothecoides]|uniref:Protein transport protein SEC23 n=1 Tax=Auxenochlorella protothecoides TaxID=3075 RepID=A0A087SRX7_AUXPR|nr:Protein transport protein SEC23 [Auxenochlorella protothecoides]KFM28481.1 Protein transport protein SEC23 [Auxenochlorella protothecoides]
MAEFVEMEEIDAVRMVWNVWPHSRLEAAKCVIPFGVMYTPAKATRGLQAIEYDPVQCRGCGAVLNPYAAVDFASRQWGCPFCLTRSPFPPHYAGISETVLPAELFPSATTVEYATARHAPPTPPTYLILLDTSVPEDELAAAKSALQQALSLIPDHAQVGLITFGTHVHVHELGHAECPKDLAKDAAPLSAPARRFYDGVAAQLVAAGHALDVYACSLDQVGLYEMKAAVELTGGLTVQTDSFANPVFREALRRAFAPPGEPGHLGLGSNATLEVRCSKDIKVCGLLGPAAAVPGDRKSPWLSDTQVGQGGATAWRTSTLAAGTTVAVVYDIVAPHGAAGDAGSPQLFLQFITRYTHECGAPRTRVTTVSRRWTDGANVGELMQGFDQEAAAVLLARLAAHKMEAEDDFDVTRWLDRSLIRLCARFGDYRKDEPDSFQLRPQLAYFPQFVFNFRRSQFCQVFGNSPDETAFARLALQRETVGEGVTMLQPLLYSYAMGAAPEPVLLDVSSIAPDRVLLLDAYFYVVVFHGTTVAQWRKAGYAEQPEYAAFKALLEAPAAEAEAIIARRFPVPRLTVCDQNGSQARFLLAKLNPSATYQSSAALSSEVIMTDDVSLSVFTEHLKKLAVQS